MCYFLAITHMAAFWGITTILIVGFINPHHRITVGDLLAGASQGVKYALSVGAVCAAIGVVVGVVNATGLGFRLGFMVTNSAVEMGESLQGLLQIIPFINFSINDITLFISLILIAVTCIFDGCWPTDDSSLCHAGNCCPASPRWTRRATAGLTLICALLWCNFRDNPSSVCLSICSSRHCGLQPIQNRTFRICIGHRKIMVPMVFVYSPAMLIVLDDYFTYAEFFQTTLTCGLGVFMLSASVAGYFLVKMRRALSCDVCTRRTFASVSKHHRHVICIDNCSTCFGPSGLFTFFTKDTNFDAKSHKSQIAKSNRQITTGVIVTQAGAVLTGEIKHNQKKN